LRPRPCRRRATAGQSARAHARTYDAAIETLRDLIERTEQQVGARGSIGMGAPGSVSPRTGVMRNANAVYLNGRRFKEDLSEALGRPIRLANDANCLALSEAADGAAQGARSTFAIILGTGCGGGWSSTASWSKAPTASAASGATFPCPGRRR
jgi:fructokinase